jgi:hypothetical protein
MGVVTIFPCRSKAPGPPSQRGFLYEPCKEIFEPSTHFLNFTELLTLRGSHFEVA